VDEIHRRNTLGVVAFAITSGALVTSLWWIVLGLFLCKRPGLVRHPLRPFADHFTWRNALALSAAGVLLLLLLAGFVALYMNGAFALFTP
jgi:hypothetical protein